jgi:histidinol-phosphate aminotransferase
MIQHLVEMRIALAEVIASMPQVEKVYPSDTNFLLVKIPRATEMYRYLCAKGIILRDRSGLPNCENTVRVTVGNEQENTELIDAMAEWIEKTF